MTSVDPRARRWWYWPVRIAALLVLIAGALLIWQWPSLSMQAELGARYTARVACSCRYVEGRSLQSCETDNEPGTEIVSMRDDPAYRRMFASVPLLAEAAAEKRGDFGCVLLTPEELDAVD